MQNSIVTREQVIAKMQFWADRINEQNEYGALHILIADGNCDDESREFCRTRHTITADETAFLDGIEADLTEEAIFGAWALAQYPRETPNAE
jgi:hypothetical protein